MSGALRTTREERAAAADRRAQERFAAERRTQLLALLALAALVLTGTVLYVGGGHVFLPGWWRWQ